MGGNSTFLILNDAAKDIINNADEFADKINTILSSGRPVPGFTDRHGYIGLGNNANVAQYVDTINSSQCELISVHGNLAKPFAYLHGGFNPYSPLMSIEPMSEIEGRGHYILRELAKQLGYDLVKRR